MKRGLLLFTLFASLVSSHATATPSTTGGADQAIEAKISALMARMSLQEKAGQLNFPSFAFPHRPQLDSTTAGRLGGVFNAVNPAHVKEFQEANAASRLKIPLLFALDSIYAFHIAFPTPIAWAATWRPELAELATEAIARETAQVGINLTFAPMIDISRDPRWCRAKCRSSGQT
jgi:beta-glucosidase